MAQASLESAVLELRCLLTQNVHEQLIAGGEPGLTQLTLERWLKARKMDVAIAAADLTKHAAWRAAWTPKQRVLEHEITQDILQDKVFLQGQDKHGRGTCVLQGRKHTLTENVSQQRCITYVIDGMIAACDPQRNPAANIVAVFELNGLGLRNLDAVGLKNIFALLQQHYVEHLDRLYMVNASSIFWGLWRVVAPFIDPVTRAKVVFVDSVDMLVQDLGAEVLPPHLGGTGQLIPVQDGWARILQQRQQQQQGDGDCAFRSVRCSQEVQREEGQGSAPQLRVSGPGYQSADAAVLIQTA